MLEPLSSSSYNTFRTPYHQRRFEGNVSGRRVVREKVFQLAPDEFPEIQDQIRQRVLMGFCNLPEKAYLSQMKEFYANTFRVKDDSLKKYNTEVRGMPIDLEKLLGSSMARG